MPRTLSMFQHLFANRHLIFLLTKREIISRYRGSYLGQLWIVVAPLLMLAVYSFFFGEILKAKWTVGSADDSLASFSLILFSGLMLHQFLADCLTRAPGLIIGNSNYVKRVVFPTEVLGVVTVLVALINLLVNLLILVVVHGIIAGQLHWQWLFLPVIYLPFLLLSLGLIWFCASLGVFLRDLGQITTYVANLLLFFSPVFYPMNLLPSWVSFIKVVNPLVYVIEESRNVLFAAQLPNWTALVTYSLCALIIAFGGYWFYMRSKPAFADVL